MQNAPAMLAQKMMSRQAAYAPVGMVSQNMSGNKKGGAAGGVVPSGPVIGLKFDTATATAGVTFSNSDTTATSPSGTTFSSAKGNAAVDVGVFYVEFTANSAIATTEFGFVPASFVCNTTDIVGGFAQSFSIQNDGKLFISNVQRGTASSGYVVGDVIGIKFDANVSGATAVTIYKNGVQILTLVTTTWLTSGTGIFFTPAFSNVGTTSVSVTISNNVYQVAGTTPLGSSVTTISASASVPAVADGAYDVYTFNASGTFTTTSTGAVRALVIAGGGGGGNTSGGGAGGYKENGATVTPQTYTVTVGGGGAYFSSGISSSFGSLISTNGGGGGNSGAGGSGSGGSPSIPGPNTVAGGAGIAGQGFAGGQGNSVSALLYGGGGGGGAGGLGNNGNTASSGIGGNGGVGNISSITGTSIGRGGGGGAQGSITNGSGANGGANATLNGTANTGGGGGGNGGAGGSGVVIIRVRARA